MSLRNTICCLYCNITITLMVATIQTTINRRYDLWFRSIQFVNENASHFGNLLFSILEIVRTIGCTVVYITIQQSHNSL